MGDCPTKDQKKKIKQGEMWENIICKQKMTNEILEGEIKCFKERIAKHEAKVKGNQVKATQPGCSLCDKKSSSSFKSCNGDVDECSCKTHKFRTLRTCGKSSSKCCCLKKLFQNSKGDKNGISKQISGDHNDELCNEFIGEPCPLSECCED